MNITRLIKKLPRFPNLARAFLLPVLALALSGCGRKAADQTVLRVGYFPNITHAQGVIGSTLTAEKKERGWFEQRLGPGVRVEWFAFNAGPTAMESMMVNSIDMTYVGPNPSLNAHMRTKGGDIRVVAGSANGGAALLVRPAANIGKPADFAGKKLATPQFGNTQDIAARVWLGAQGFNITQTGGDVSVIPTANPDQLALFQQGKIDAVWTVEPWVSRIEREAGGTVFLDEPDAITTVLVASVRALKEKPVLVARFTQAHRELTDWVNKNPAGAQALVQRGITETVKREIPLDLVQASWKRLHFTAATALPPFEKLVREARELGFIKDNTPLDRFIITVPAPAAK
ncbi:MAG: ABC transporter substrate-binding protein [Opitutaceae bacterium]|jgi:NitT/TauT family transport system substrate-binding protein|nr:ABC transporter substrate-binding protein [Opitutaceae bacterium]